MKAKKHFKSHKALAKLRHKQPAGSVAKLKQKKRVTSRAGSVVKSKNKFRKIKPQKSKLKTKSQPKEIIIHQEPVPQAILSDYVFAFELTRPYPTLRSYILKQPLKKPVKDILFELFGTKK